jgi:hypothetical protein
MAKAKGAYKKSDKEKEALSKIKEIASFVAGGKWSLECAQMTPGEKIDLMKKLMVTGLSPAKLLMCFLLILDPDEVRQGLSSVQPLRGARSATIKEMTS